MQKVPVGPLDPIISDTNLDALVAELAADGITITKQDARYAVRRLADLLLLISRPLSNSQVEEPVPETEAPPPSPSGPNPVPGEAT